MLSIEIVLFMVIFMVSIVGLMRGPSKELGVTMAVVVLLAILSQFSRLVDPGGLAVRANALMSGLGMGSGDAMRQRTFVWFLYSSIIIMTAFMAYHGQATLAFGFQDPKGIWGALLGALVGAFNGWLIGGTIWYYLDLLDYPIRVYDWFVPQFTEGAQRMVSLLPQNLLNPVIFAIMALGLLWWRILK